MKQEGSPLHLRGLYIGGFQGHVESTGEARTGWRELLQRLGRVRRGSGGGFGVKRVQSDCVLAACKGKFWEQISAPTLMPRRKSAKLTSRRCTRSASTPRMIPLLKTIDEG